jgi:hypothetical protein
MEGQDLWNLHELCGLFPIWQGTFAPRVGGRSAMPTPTAQVNHIM